MATSLEWFGATTFRLKTKGLTIFLDTWLERPACMPQYLHPEDVTECDYIFISHAHFDHLPGANKIAIKTGATVIGNGEAINCLRQAGVPEEQLLPVAGGERIPLFTKDIRQQARDGAIKTAPGPPGAPVRPDSSFAAIAVHVWPSLHCLMPGSSHADIPDVMDTGKRFVGSANDYACTIDITIGMKYGLLKLGDHLPAEHRDEGSQSFIDYIDPAKGHVLSNFDGGQLLYNFLIDDKVLLWNGHLGGYDGILSDLQPRPNVLVQAIAGRANLNGRPFDGSAAEFAVKVSKWLGEPEKVIWCLHDDAPIAPRKVDTAPAKQLLEAETKSKVIDLQPAKVISLF